MKKCFFALIIFMTSLSSLAQNYWQQEAHYKMDIDFNSANHQFDGLQELTYINHSPDTLHKVFYHLYLNAFQPGSMMDIRSRTILDSDRRVGNRIAKLKPSEMGTQEIISLKQNGAPLSYELNETILEVSLNKPILPNDTIELSMSFKTQVPLQIRRTGRMNSEGIDYSMSQWYPKLCEYDKDGWHANPYVGREFYGVWGSFDVTIHMDSKYTIAASGILQNPDEIGHGYTEQILDSIPDRLSWNFKAENVHDFVWAADPDYTHEIIINEKGPNFHLFYQEGEKTKHWKDLGEYMVRTFEYADKHFGEYPYPHYAIIQGGDGGMEYPMATLITGHRSLKSLVGVSVHEAMHSWYHGLLATNEALYAWMDEGFTSYASNRIEYQFFPEDFPNTHGGSYKSYQRIANSDYEEPLCTHADHFDTNWAYGVASYSKGVVILDQLSHIVGHEVVDRSLKRYFDEWAYKHPDARDFKRIVEKESDLELDWYFEYFVNSVKTIDFGIYEISKNEDGTLITLKRGEMPMPVEFEVELHDGRLSNYYIPMVLMRGEKEVASGTKVLTDWPWTNPYYSINIEHHPTEIKEIRLHNTGHIADVESLNDNIVVPKKWKWDKHLLRLEVLEKKKKKSIQNSVKMRKIAL